MLSPSPWQQQLAQNFRCLPMKSKFHWVCTIYKKLIISKVKLIKSIMGLWWWVQINEMKSLQKPHPSLVWAELQLCFHFFGYSAVDTELLQPRRKWGWCLSCSIKWAHYSYRAEETIFAATEFLAVKSCAMLCKRARVNADDQLTW